MQSERAASARTQDAVLRNTGLTQRAGRCAPPAIGESALPPDAGGRDCPPLPTLQRSRIVAQVLTAAVSPYDSPSLPGAPATESGPLPLKIRQAPVRPGLVPRERLVRRLLEARDVAVAFILAPAGYGKTTVLSQWSQQDERPFAWVTLDAQDNDPKNLVTAIALALESVEPLGWEVFEAMTSEWPDATDVALQRLVRELGQRETRLCWRWTTCTCSVA